MKHKISFPHMGKYSVPIKKLIEELVGDSGEVMLAPSITKKTIELGSKHSPEFVCIPFKYNLGNFIEALENGATVLFHTSGDCRMGFYNEVQEQILRDLGYEFEMCILETNSRNRSLRDFYGMFKRLNPRLTYARTIKAILLAVRIVFAMDKIERYVRQNIGFETQAGTLEEIENTFLRDVAKAKSIFTVGKLYKQAMRKLESVPLNKPQNALKIGVVGELYVLMEPFSNYFIEKELAKFGIEVTRFIDVSYLLFSPKHKIPYLVKESEGYATYDIGADGTDSVAKCVYFAKNGYDGIIHLKPFGCTPEVNSIPICQKISEDLGIPILYFSFDSQTSETGVKTRLEAFYDMIEMKRETVK
ncbi:MAG: 2-hydroxyacyl-CoA dehydratase [Defluviitaleaceae bacterium]|nr:2-hydroxyacyl-CoA dehydratase [Defluviitaleaceae bacterium]MCL2263025.1 2-hydroxyacyl-CoA dehydratase [Defluviitaleaceae bacterium]